MGKSNFGKMGNVKMRGRKTKRLSCGCCVAIDLRHDDGKCPTLQDAATEAAVAKSWTCKTCDTMVEADGDHCRACAQYWRDVEDGVFDDQDYGDAYEQAMGDF